MVNERFSWIRLLAIGALLLTLAASARGGFRAGHAPDTFANGCELNPPRDAAALERCLALQPRDIELMLDLGAVYESTGSFERAEALYKQALTIDPKDGDLHVRLGRLLLRRGDRAAAAEQAHVALTYQPRSPRALGLLTDAGHEAEQ